jgi:choline monooxygenase
MNQATAEEILGYDVAAALAQPIDRARGLPASAYTSQAFFDLEQRQLFPRTWVGVAFAEDIPERGDALPLTVSAVPVVILRDAAGEIRAFHNVCRHRATIVLERPAKGLSMLQCPYHAWTYGLDGALKATPFWDGTKGASRAPVDRASNGLVAIRCAVWNHIVFVNLDGKAAPLSEYLAPADRLLADIDIGSLRQGFRFTWDFKANWKLVNDNWEVYHHVWVHEGVFDKMSDEVNLAPGETYTEMRPDGNVLVLRRKADAPARPGSAPLSGHAMPLIPVKPGAKPFGGCTSAILPNTTVTMGISGYSPAIYTPIAPGVTRAHMAWYFVGDAATAPEFAASRNRVIDRWLGPARRYDDRSGIRSQDHHCMELQQAARFSPVADSVQFSPSWEVNVHYFQKWLLAQLGTRPAAS